MILYRKLAVLFALALLLGLTVMPTSAAPPQQGAADWDIPNGHFYTQTAGPSGRYGFSVVDDRDARFWSEFRRLGGLQTVGYPISRRFVHDGFVTQAFQKLVLQWRPEVNQAWPLNIFDELSYAGLDDVLFISRQTPRQFPAGSFDSPGAPWAAVVAARHALLNDNPAIRARYFSVADPLNVFGLPTSRVEDMGNHYAIRTQRAVFQQWKEQVPWASVGQVTIANGGDIAKEFGWFSAQAIAAEPWGDVPPFTTWESQTLLVGPGSPGRLYALQHDTLPPHDFRLRVSDDLGATWRPFAGGLPEGNGCLHNINIDYATVDALYASTCDGLYRWTGSLWQKISQQVTTMVAITYGKPQSIWAVGPGSEGPTVLHSDNSGQSWNEEGLTRFGAIDLAINPRDANQVYALWGHESWWYTLFRSGGNGNWAAFPPPNPSTLTASGMALDEATGALYLSAFVPTLGDATNVHQIWRVPNPNAPDITTIDWQLVHDFGLHTHARLLAAGKSPSGGLALYAALRDAPGVSTIHRSFDGGASWQPMTIP